MKAALLGLLLFSLAACGTADFWYLETNNLSGGPTIFIVRWSDSGVEDAEQVVVALDRLELVGPEGTETLLDERRSYDLLELRGGRFAELARESVPSGSYSHLRFHLAPDGMGLHRVRVGGVDHPLLFTTPGASTVDLPYRLELEPDTEQTVHVDFNVRLSVTEAGGDWRLQPHLRGLDPAGAGAIVGEVRGSAGGAIAAATVSAQQDGAEILSTQTLFDGTFHLGPLAPGRYTLVATAPGHAPAVEANVMVLAGETGGSRLLFLDTTSPGGVSGTVPAPRPGLVLHVASPAGLIAIVGVDPQTGSFSVPDLAPGTYGLELRDGAGRVDSWAGIVVTMGVWTDVDLP